MIVHLTCVIPAVNSVTPIFCRFCVCVRWPERFDRHNFYRDNGFCFGGKLSCVLVFPIYFFGDIRDHCRRNLGGTLSNGRYARRVPWLSSTCTPTASVDLSCFGQELMIIFLPFLFRCFSVSMLFRCTGWICLPCCGPHHLVQQWLFEYHQR